MTLGFRDRFFVSYGYNNTIHINTFYQFQHLQRQISLADIVMRATCAFYGMWNGGKYQSLRLQLMSVHQIPYSYVIITPFNLT